MISANYWALVKKTNLWKKTSVLPATIEQDTVKLLACEIHGLL